MGLRQRQTRPKPEEVAAYMRNRHGLSGIRFEKSYRHAGEIVVFGQRDSVEYFDFLSNVIREMRSV